MTSEVIAYLIGSEFMDEESKSALLTKFRKFKDDEGINLPTPIES